MYVAGNTNPNVPFELVSSRMEGDSHFAWEHLAEVAVPSWRTQKGVNMCVVCET